jgi:hypothetical protein
MEAWKNNLPENLRFRGPDTHRNAGERAFWVFPHYRLLSIIYLCVGILHLFYSCVCMIFWRVFMRISYSCPDHLKFGLTVEQWSGLVQLTGESIDWLDKHERVYDVWLLVAYAATSCALVQVCFTMCCGMAHLDSIPPVPYMGSTEGYRRRNQTPKIA